MKKICLLILFAVNLSFSQSNYRPAYYITNSGNKVEGFVSLTTLDVTYINFKSTLNNDESKLNLTEFKELVVSGNEKYVSKSVEYAANRLKEATLTIKENNEPEIKRKQLLLQVLIEGEASLYTTAIDEQSFYYLKMDNSDEFINLIYYKHRNDNDDMTEYTLYKKQLLQYLNCGNNSTLDKFYSIEYAKNELRKVVSNYNVCKNGKNIDVTKASREKFKIAAIVGGKLQMVNFEHPDFYGSINSDNYISPSIGLELSLLLPTRSKSLELFFKTSFDMIKFNSKNQTPVGSGVSIIYEQMNFEANILHFDIGPRYYFKGRYNNSFFVEGAFQYNYLLSNDLNYVISTNPNSQNFKYVDAKSSISFNLGVGYLFKKKYSIDAGYSFGANYTDDNAVATIISNRVSSLNLNLKYIF